MSTSNNHEISLQTAIDMTTLYRKNRPANFPLCETFEKDAIYKLLEADGSASLRIYYGMKENMEVDAVLVAANADGEDMLPDNVSSLTESGNPLILEDGYRCPQACPPPSKLNGG